MGANQLTKTHIYLSLLLDRTPSYIAWTRVFIVVVPQPPAPIFLTWIPLLLFCLLTMRSLCRSSPVLVFSILEMKSYLPLPDPEVTFFFPWAVPLNKIDLFGFWSMMAFLLILTIGFIYEWKKGASDRE